LQTLPQWVLWRYELRKGKDKPTKVLYNPHTGARAKSDTPSTWGTYEQVCVFLRASAPVYDGIGFVVTADDPFCGIDLDDCFNPETGEIAPQAAAIVERMHSYTEITVSGRGLRIWLQGTLPPGKRRVGHIEMYDSARFFTITGRVLAGSPGEILLRQDELLSLHQEVFPPSTTPTKPSARKSGDAPLSLSDQDIIQKAQEARNGAKFRSLYHDGATSGDASGDDLALCNLLAFWVGGDAATMDRIFRGSALMREKWNEKHAGDGRTYGQMTIDRAIADCRESYRPGGEDDGYTTIAKAAEALGVSRMTVNRWASEPDVVTKRTSRGTLLVHLESLLQSERVKSCNTVTEEGVTPDNVTTNVTTYAANNCNTEATLQPKNDNVTTSSTKSCNTVTDDDANVTPICNNTLDWIETGKGSKAVYYARRMQDMYAQILDTSNGWPRRIGNLLFFDRDGEICFMEKPPAFFSWMADYGSLSWRTGLSCDNISFVTKEEMMAYTVSHCESYEDIANLPHEPVIPGFYYSWRPLEHYQPTGEYFAKLLSFFTNVETVCDGLLVKAMFMTPAWGGPLNKRPAFAITAPDRGCGKSTLAEAVGLLYNGLIDINLSKRAEEEIIQRLLTPSARLQRVVRIDNIKGEVNSALLDTLITATHISGKQMYTGDARRVNTLVYILTGNGLRLSRDMAERCFIIKLTKPQYIADWEAKTTQFIVKYRDEILMDIIALLQQPAPHTEAKDRWMQFVAEVLARAADDDAAPIATCMLNSTRREGSDTDIEEAEILLESIKNISNSAGESMGKGWVFLPRNVVVNACNDALNLRLPTRTILAILRDHVNAGRMRDQLRVDHKTNGQRGVLYKRDEDGLFGADGA